MSGTRFASQRTRHAAVRDAVVEAGATDEGLCRRDARVLASWQTGEPLNFKSEHYNLSLMTPNFAPPPVAKPHIPVLIAAVQERMLQVAGEVCDGVRLHGIVTRNISTKSRSRI